VEPLLSLEHPAGGGGGGGERQHGEGGEVDAAGGGGAPRRVAGRGRRRRDRRCPCRMMHVKFSGEPSIDQEVLSAATSDSRVGISDGD
jgi:hypothetical protein